MADSNKTKERKEPKATLPVGHPKAGYVDPDLSYHEGTGVIPDEEVEWHEARNEAREEQIDEVAEGEDKAAKEEQEEREKEAEIMRKRAEHIEKQKYGDTAGQLPSDASYRQPTEKSSSSSSSSSGSKTGGTSK